MNTRTISVADFCQMSGLGKTTAHKLIKSGKLQSTRVGRRRLICRKDAEALIVPHENTSLAAGSSEVVERGCL